MYLLKASAPGLNVHDGGLHILPGAQHTEKSERFRHLLRERLHALQVCNAGFTRKALEPLPDVRYHSWCTEEAAHEAGLKKHGALQSMPLHTVDLLVAQ